MKSAELIDTLIQKTSDSITQVEELKNLDLDILTWRQDQNSWNILECIEHLNLYGDFYLPQIGSKIRKNNTKHEEEFKSGILGSYFAKSMLPREKLNKMKTFKDKNPLNKNLNDNVIHKFIANQHDLINLLTASKNVSLNKVKISTSISSLISLKLGDTFQFYINHIIRHLKQKDNIKQAKKNK